MTKFEGREFVEFTLIRNELETLTTKLAIPYLKESDYDFLANKILEMELAIKEKKYASLTHF